MKKTFESSLETLPKMTSFVKGYLKKTPIPLPLQDRLDLGVEEALVNIISYAYPNDKGPITIETGPENSDQITITITDEGAPFDPLRYLKDNPPHLGTEKMTVGGYGVFLMIEIFDEVTYRRTDEKNILILSHHLNRG